MSSAARLAAAFGTLAVLASASAAGAATLRVINRDGPGEGFNDPTPVAPIGGNPGTTLGAQRLIAFQYAADIWGEHLISPFEIRISATFDPLTCNSNSVTLGTAGPVSVMENFSGAPRRDTFYPAALANILHGGDLDPNEDEIEAVFNSSFGTTCPFPAGWYYGLDASGFGDDSDFVTVVMHELGHGLGFLSLVDVETGARFMGSDDVFSLFLISARTNERFLDMTASERRNAIEDTGFLRWDGGAVVAASGSVQVGADELGRVELYAPAFAQVGSSVSHWSDDVAPAELLAPFFVGPNHQPGLALPALVDIGWTTTSGGSCAGDCAGNGTVTIDDLILAVRVALGESPVTVCLAADRSGDGEVSIDDLIAAVGSALNGCG
ncbi:MAG: hypothetical protein SF182_27385 [Deltaproteobacteria bacterium]|nr:hypothetical protein [Deltaproteobacteria bacterium]